MARYRLTMTSEQARKMMSAVDFLMRLKLGQYKELPYMLMEYDDDYCKKRDKANVYLEDAFQIMLGRNIRKDKDWYILYNILQVVRHAIQQEEYPDSQGVDSYEPRDFKGVGMPKVEVVR